MKNYNLLLLLCLFLYTTGIPSVFAQEQEEEETFAQPIQELPFMEAVYPQEQHEIQATSSYFHAEDEAQVGNSFSFEIEYGITDWLQVSAELEDSRLHSQPNSVTVYQMEAGTMLSLIRTPRQAASFSLQAEFPLNRHELDGQEAEDAEISFTPALIYARQLGNTQVHVSGGAELQAHELEWFYNAAVVYGSGRFHPLLELNGTVQEDADLYIGPGLVLNGNSGWELVAGARRSLLQPDWDFSLRLLFEFSAGGN